MADGREELRDGQVAAVARPSWLVVQQNDVNIPEDLGLTSTRGWQER